MSAGGLIPCQACGARLPGGLAGCESLFQELAARDFTEVRYFPTHRVLVDCYALQHPEQYAASGKSFAAHLTGLCVWLEHAGDPLLNRKIQRWLSTNPALERPTPPARRGSVTILDVFTAGSLTQHKDMIQAWARAVWQAYTDYHDLARGWIAQTKLAT
jgi:hypothetical protein